MLLTSDGASSFNWQHFSFLVAYKIMVHLTIDSILDLMKCSNNGLVHVKAEHYCTGTAVVHIRLGYLRKQQNPFSVSLSVILIKRLGFFRTSSYLRFASVLCPVSFCSHSVFISPRLVWKTSALTWISESTWFHICFFLRLCIFLPVILWVKCFPEFRLRMGSDHWHINVALLHSALEKALSAL